MGRMINIKENTNKLLIMAWGIYTKKNPYPKRYGYTNDMIINAALKTYIKNNQEVKNENRTTKTKY